MGVQLLGCGFLAQGYVAKRHRAVIYDLLTLPHWGLSPQGLAKRHRSAQICCPFTYSAVFTLKEIMICIWSASHARICLLFASTFSVLRIGFKAYENVQLSVSCKDCRCTNVVIDIHSDFIKFSLFT